ncbi:MAG: hypothetical protein NTZ21_06380 [Actinobacteria bacterium]|nr:hypothetical protein [Actinomycetota bacterium]
MDWTAPAGSHGADDLARDTELASAAHEAKIAILRAIAAATTSSASDAAEQTLALAKAFRLLDTPGGWTMYETPKGNGDLAYDGDEQITDEG